MPGVHAVLTRDETAAIPMPVYGYFIKDQPVVATDKVRYEGDIVAAVAALDEGTANRALAAIRVEYEPLPIVTDLESASDPDAAELFEEAPIGIVPKYGQGASGELRPRKNVCYRFSYETGPADAFADCDHVFEDVFHFSRMHHFHLEPFVCVADWSREDRIELWTSCQNPFPCARRSPASSVWPRTGLRCGCPISAAASAARTAARPSRSPSPCRASPGGRCASA